MRAIMKRAIIACLCVACGGEIDSSPRRRPTQAWRATQARTLRATPASSNDAQVASDADASTTLTGACVPGDDFDEAVAPAPHSLRVGAASYLESQCSNVAYGMKILAKIQIAADGSAGTPPVLASITTVQGQRIELAAVPGTTDARCTISGYGGPPIVHDFTMARGAWHDVGLKISFNDDGTNNFICVVDTGEHGAVLPASQTLGNATLRIGAQSTPQS